MEGMPDTLPAGAGERRRGRPQGRDLAVRLSRDARALATPGGVRGAVVESVWLGAHAVTYPFGLMRERLDRDRYGLEHLRPRQRSLIVRDVEAAGTPILLLHGMIDNRAVFAPLKRTLRSHGFTRVRTLNYSPLTNDIRAAALDLSAEVERLVADTGYERIHVVGHSLGGLIARYYVQRLGGGERVHTLVTLGTPHRGSLAAWLIPARLGRQLRPGSDLFAELAEPVGNQHGVRTRFVAYWSDLDQLIVPHDSARLDHPGLAARNVLVRGRGHMSLPIDPQVSRDVSALLSELDPDGSTLNAGITRLPTP